RRPRRRGRPRGQGRASLRARRQAPAVGRARGQRQRPVPHPAHAAKRSEVAPRPRPPRSEPRLHDATDGEARVMRLGVALSCALVACGGDDAMMTGPDAGATGDGALGDSGDNCTTPSLDAPWLANLLADAVTGLTAAPRYQLTERQAARAFLQDQLADMGWTPQLHGYNTGANVYATIPATTGETKQILVGAHYDTVANSPGANDNATGCAAVLAVARYLEDMTCRRYAVTVVFF